MKHFKFKSLVVICLTFGSFNSFATSEAPLSARATIEIGYSKTDVASKSLKTIELCKRTIDLAQSSPTVMSANLKCDSTLNGLPVTVEVRVMLGKNLNKRTFNGQDIYVRSNTTFMTVKSHADSMTPLQLKSVSLQTQPLQGGGYVIDLQPPQWIVQLQCLNKAESHAEVVACADQGEVFIATVYIQEN